MYGLMYGLRYNYLKIWNLRVQKNLNIEKIAFKVVQMNFLAMHMTNLRRVTSVLTCMFGVMDPVNHIRLCKATHVL